MRGSFRRLLQKCLIFKRTLLQRSPRRFLKKFLVAAQRGKIPFFFTYDSHHSHSIVFFSLFLPPGVYFRSVVTPHEVPYDTLRTGQY